MRFISLFLVLVAACSSSSSTSSSGSSSSGGTDGGGSSSGGSSSGGSSGNAADTGALVNNCSAFVDRTATDASRVLTWDTSLFSKPERCMKVKVGQTIKFTSDGLSTPADFAQHPIGAQGGDQPNTVTNVDDDTGELVFTAPGTFGFTCTVHFNMIGAFEVVE